MISILSSMVMALILISSIFRTAFRCVSICFIWFIVLWFYVFGTCSVRVRCVFGACSVRVRFSFGVLVRVFQWVG